MTANQITWVKFNGVLFLHCFVQPIRLHKAWKQLFGNRAFIWKNKVCYLTLIVAGRPKQFPSGLSWKTLRFASSATNHIHRTWCDYQVRYPDLDCSQLTRSIGWKCTSHTCLGPRNWPFILALCRGSVLMDSGGSHSPAFLNSGHKVAAFSRFWKSERPVRFNAIFFFSPMNHRSS